MPTEINRYERKLANRLNRFSGNFMSNAKWTKLFMKLSDNNDLILKCDVKTIFDEVLTVLEIPSKENFLNTFYDKGIEDVMTGGPTTFKEIEWIEFPSQWVISREMRGQILQPFNFSQDILKIKNLLEDIGELEIEFDNEKSVIFGYK